MLLLLLLFAISLVAVPLFGVLAWALVRWVRLRRTSLGGSAVPQGSAHRPNPIRVEEVE